MKSMSLFAAVFVSVLLLVPVMGAAGTITNNAIAIKATLVSQDPVSAEPGGYVTLLFKFENWGTIKAENVTVELLSQYPFSLDSGASAVQELGTIGSLSTDDKAYFVKYKVRVDKDAINGDNEIGVRCAYGNSAFAMSSVQKFNVTVSNPKTDFDVIVQDSSSGTTSLAIANVGSNTAYSVVVNVPEQSGYRVSGASATVLGNLDASDYTLVSFQITPTQSAASTQAVTPPQAGRVYGNFSTSGMSPLKVDIAYTDDIGIRRTVEKEVSLAGFSDGGLNATSARTRTYQGGLSFSSGGLLYIVIGVVGIAAVVAFFKLRKRKK